MSTAAYALDGIHFAYPGPSPGFSLDLDPLRIESGEILALVGPNGAGKTTLLMILAFLLRPSRGRLEFFEQEYWPEEAGTVRARREAVLVTHHPYLFKGTVLDNVAFGLKVRGTPEAEWPGRVGRALELVELAGWEGKSVAGLSAGQAQRVALARAMALRPKALLLDEPTANIEAGLALRIEAVILEISRETGATVVFSSHNFSQASRLADDILYLSDGRRVRYSHENCFSGTAETDGRQSWIEPRPGCRLVFPGAVSGHITCVINPANIQIFRAGDPAAAGPGQHMFSGRVTRLETTENNMALVRVTGGLTFRVTVPLHEIEARGISLSRTVLIKFEPEAIEIIGSEPPEKPHD
jgi:tungstate transport system ATP-binding protein